MTKTETAKNLLKSVLVKKNRCRYYEIDGRKYGEYKSWHYNGNALVHCHFKNDKFDGEYKSWYDNGRLYAHGYYKDGKLDGEYKRWHPDGRLLELSHYKDGIKI